MIKIALLLPALALTLAACGEEPAPEPTPTAAPTSVEPALPAPNQASFTAAFVKACPAADTVNTAACKRAGFGSSDVICEYGLGEDTYLRHKATLTPGEGEWTLKDPETTCAEHGAE